MWSSIPALNNRYQQKSISIKNFFQGFRNLSNSDISTIFDSAPFTQWHFQIQAANPAGAGPWSSSLDGQTLGTAPGPVGDFSAQTLTPDAVQLSWRPPQIPNGQITGYEVGLEVNVWGKEI